MRKIDTDQRRAAAGKRAGRALLALSRATAGLTLIELLVALALAAILAGAAAPSLQSLLQKQLLRAALNDVQGAIALTRSLAIARGGVVLMAPHDASGDAWERGWTVFADRNGNRRPDPGEERYAVQQPMADGIHLGAQFTSGTGPAYLAYNAAGRSCQAGNSQAARWGTLTLEAGQHKRLVKINMLGRVRVCDPVAQPALCTSAD
ncbi:GspH/FimT family protein [Pseudoduganella aquatica]|uniref:GspH/FimT family protein n=1 Tax=Pseudoduganella aquatica TaxID=2660641 RepID=UPI001E339A77|nr:GspH/FimT family protein [Pseudoduganella aquatica]